jgi:TolB-like protein/Flp pilus assembly protein TadD
MDIVGYSKLLSDKQRQVFQFLNEIVRSTQQFQKADAADKLVRLPTGDGMVLAFFTSVDAPVRCAQEISRKLREHPELQLRMGINSGPVDEVSDVNDRRNVTGIGINMAQRVMDCGDAGHILLSRRVADDLAQYAEWKPYLHELGQIEVKHGVKIELVNFYQDGVGKSELPSKLKQAQQQEEDTKRQAAARRRKRILQAISLGAVALIIGLWSYLHWKSSRVTPFPIVAKSIAVLPLENLSADKENAYFADGIQDELLSDLAKIKDLKVISRTSVMPFKAGITRNLREIAQQLGVSNVVEGSVRRAGDHIRVSVQLIDALNDRHIWSENYDRTLADSLALQGELAIEIADAIGASLTPQEKARVEAKQTKNTAAYEAYLRGRVLAGALTTDFSHLQPAAKSFRDAVTLDPSFSLAWAYLSIAESHVYWDSDDHTAARLAAAKDAADHALTLKPGLPENHLALGYYRYYGLRDFEGALMEFQLAEQGLPNNVDVLKAIGLIQRRFGRWDETIAVLHRVVELDPRDIQSASILAGAYVAKRNFSDAMRVADRILAVEPSNAPALGTKMYCLWASGKVEAADWLLAKPGTDLHLRVYQALAMHRFTEAVGLLLTALKDAHGEDKSVILLNLGLAEKLVGNVAASKAAYQQAVQEFTLALTNTPENSGPAAQLHSNLGVAYAGVGNAASAISEGKKGMVIQPTSEDPFEGPLREQDMAIIYTLLGDADNAIPILKRWIDVPSSTDIAPELLRIDPTWDPIRSDPRFQKLVAEKKT